MMDIINLMKRPPFLSKQVVSGEYYFLSPRPAAGEPGAVVCGGVERCDPQYRVVRSRFRYHSIEFVLSGAGELVTNGRRHALGAGSVFYYSPTTQHEIATDPQRPMTKYFVDFCGSRFVRPLENHPLSGHEPCRVGGDVQLADIFASLQRYGRGASAHSQRLCDCLLEMLILVVAEHALPQDEAESLAQRTYRRCRDVIEANYLKLRTLKDVAGACHVNATYLCRLFKRYASESPYQMLVRLKMRHAVDQLGGSRALIKQVAKMAGFSDPYHFSRVFKKVYGASPRLFLANARRAGNE